MAIAAADPAPAEVITWARGSATLPAAHTPGALVSPVPSRRRRRPGHVPRSGGEDGGKDRQWCWCSMLSCSHLEGTSTVAVSGMTRTSPLGAGQSSMAVRSVLCVFRKRLYAPEDRGLTDRLSGVIGCFTGDASQACSGVSIQAGHAWARGRCTMRDASSRSGAVTTWRST